MTEKKNKNERRLHVITVELPVKLTQEEMMAKAQQLAQCEIDIQHEKDHADAVKKDLKTREGLLLVKRSTIAGHVRSGEEPRPVQVEAWARFKEGVYEEVRMDTGEVLRQTRRRLMERELQDELPLPPPEKTITELKKEAKELLDSTGKQLAGLDARQKERDAAAALAKSLVDGPPKKPAKTIGKKKASKEDGKPAAP